MLATSDARHTSAITILKPCGLNDRCGRITAEKTGRSKRSESVIVALPTAIA
jgi:hypothetical protein